MIKKLLALLSLVILGGSMAGCESTTEPSNTTTSGLVTANDRALFVVNEGNFGKTNSSLDVIVLRNANSSNASATHDTVYYRNVLAGMGEGNDILLTGTTALVLDNASNSLIVVRIDSLIKKTAISFGLDQPNKMAFIGSDQVLVTRRGRPSAAIVDLKTNTIVDTIAIGEPSIAVAVLNNKAYVTSEGVSGAHVNVVDLTSRKVTKSTAVVTGPETIWADSANTQFLVSSIGDYTKIPPVFYWFNGVSGEIKDTVNSAPAGQAGPSLVGGDKFFTIDGGTVRPLNMKTLVTSAPIIESATPFYQGFYDKSKDELYLGVSDFAGATGKVNVYNGTTGAFKWSFVTGIAPAHFALYH